MGIQIPWLKRYPLVGIVLIALACVLLFSAFAWAAEFSASMFVQDQTGEVTGRVFVKNGMIRNELDGWDQTIVYIIDSNQKVAWQLLPGNMYMEIPVSEAPNTLVSEEYEEVNLGVETVEGYVCDVIRFIYKDKSLGAVTHWIARKLGYPLRIEETDAAGKVKATAEFSRIKEEALCGCLFEPPEGYERLALFDSMLGKGGGKDSTGVPDSISIPGFPGDLSSIPGIPEDVLDILKDLPGLPEGIPGMPQGMSGMPQMPAEPGPDLPDMYGGTFSVIVSGEREWETLVGGIGPDEFTRHKEIVREEAVVYVPQIVLSTGTVAGAKSPIRATVSFDFRRYENDVVIERWLCEEQTVETEFSPCLVQYNKFDPFASGVYTVAYGGFDFLGPIGELSYYYSDGTMYHKEKAYYSGHGFSFTVPVPGGTDRLSGSKTVRFEGADDWITAEMSWDLKPVTGK